MSIIKNFDYQTENQNYTNQWTGFQRIASDRGQLVDIAAAGLPANPAGWKIASQCKILPADIDPAGNVATRQRAEASAGGKTWPVDAGHPRGDTVVGDHFFVSWWTYFHPTYCTPNGGNWGHLVQYHPHCPIRSTPVGVTLANTSGTSNKSTWQVEIFVAKNPDNKDCNDPTTTSGGVYSNYPPGTHPDCVISPYTALDGTWAQFTMEVLWSVGSNGIFRVWLNNVQKFEWLGPNMFSAFDPLDDDALYIKQGMYRRKPTGEWNGNLEFRIWHAGTKMATTKAEAEAGPGGGPVTGVLLENLDFQTETDNFNVQWTGAQRLAPDRIQVKPTADWNTILTGLGQATIPANPDGWDKLAGMKILPTDDHDPLPGGATNRVRADISGANQGFGSRMCRVNDEVWWSFWGYFHPFYMVPGPGTFNYFMDWHGDCGLGQGFASLLIDNPNGAAYNASTNPWEFVFVTAIGNQVGPCTGRTSPGNIQAISRKPFSFGWHRFTFHVIFKETATLNAWYFDGALAATSTDKSNMLDDTEQVYPKLATYKAYDPSYWQIAAGRTHWYWATGFKIGTSQAIVEAGPGGGSGGGGGGGGGGTGGTGVVGTGNTSFRTWGSSEGLKTLAHTVANNSNRFMVVRVMEDGPGSVTGITFNGDALTKQHEVSRADNGLTISWWGLVNPDVIASGTVSATKTPGHAAIMSVADFFDVDQTSPWGTFDDQEGTDFRVENLDYVSATGNMVLDAVVVEDEIAASNLNATPDSGQTSAVNTDVEQGTSQGIQAATSRKTGAAQVDTGWNISVG